MQLDLENGGGMMIRSYTPGKLTINDELITRNIIIDRDEIIADWNPVELGSTADGFGAFDFALTDGVGEMNDAVAEPGESIVFILDIAGAGVTMSDFVVANDSGYVAAAKFVNGPNDPESPGNEDSAFGAVVPEPSAALLFGIGLAIAAAARSRR